MVHVVARVEDPYGRDVASDRPPLAVGLFVEAEIEGRTISEAFVLPRTALRRPIRGSGDLVLIVDDESRLHFRPVELLRAQQDHVVVGEGLRAGERICVSPIRAVVDGMRVRVADDPVAEALAGAKP